MEIRSISSAQTFAVRHPILRSGRPLESCNFKGDDDLKTQHFGAFEGHKLMGVLSCYNNNGTHFSKGENYQIRGVAIIESMQQKGIGKVLMLHAEKVLKEINCEYIWLNARVNAESFYTKLNYQKNGAIFDVAEIGPHQCFIKKINR